jgi:hypothetical protein
LGHGDRGACCPPPSRRCRACPPTRARPAAPPVVLAPGGEVEVAVLVGDAALGVGAGRGRGWQGRKAAPRQVGAGQVRREPGLAPMPRLAPPLVLPSASPGASPKHPRLPSPHLGVDLAVVPVGGGVKPGRQLLGHLGARPQLEHALLAAGAGMGRGARRGANAEPSTPRPCCAHTRGANQAFCSRRRPRRPAPSLPPAPHPPIPICASE